MVTLAGYCVAHDLDMMGAGETELARIVQPEIVQKIRAKQAAKPTGSALPIAVTAQDDDKLRPALTDLVSWFDKPVQGERGMVWVIRAGDQGADDAVAEALAALKSTAAQKRGSV